MAADHEILKWKLNRASVWQKYDSVKAPSIQAMAMWLYPCVIKEILMMPLMYGAFTQLLCTFLDVFTFLRDPGTYRIQGRDVPKDLGGQ